MKLGDWIVIFSEGAHIVQYDTPERILAEPANEFVENFIGSGAGLKQLTLARVGDVDLAEAVVARPGEPGTEVVARVEAAGHAHAVVVDERDRPVSWPSLRQLRRVDVVSATPDADLPVVGSGATLNDALDTMLVSSAGAALVPGRRDAFIGVITVEVVMDAITRARKAAAIAATDAPVGTNTGPLSVLPEPAAGGTGTGSAGSEPDAAAPRDVA